MGNEITKFFEKNRKCIINADLDGLLSGMILHEFLDWQIVGFSSCSGKLEDDLWLYEINENLQECVFVDLPVYIKEYSTIDQHFISFDRNSIIYYKNNNNKINPNIIRERVLKNDSGISEYKMKYPFGTIHFIIAVLENLGIIDKNYSFPFEKIIGNFDLADLILRADRVIGNTYSYRENCVDWLSWLSKIGRKNTNIICNKVQNELMIRKQREINVEQKMKQLGCKGIDGDCSNMLKNKDYVSLNNYFNFLSQAMNMDAISVKQIFNYGKLKGTRYEINNNNFDLLKKETLKKNVFSFAFVKMNTLSITYIEGVE